MRRIIALLTDYGYKDPYVGVVKAVIKSINPDADIVDLTHGVERHNVLEAALMLAVSAKYFPPGTIFVVVVDPGVGGARKAILIETANYILIGPDNGCLTLLAQMDGVKRVLDISNSKYRLPKVSHTFHGRDIFVPVAAWVSKGIPLSEVGVEIDYRGLVKLDIERPRIDVERGIVEGKIIYIDVFGNAMTNIASSDLSPLGLEYGSKISLVVGGKRHYCTFETTFSKVPAGELACYFNSWDYLEIAVNMGNAAAYLGIRPGEPVVLEYVKTTS